jgi:cytoskeletal protein CcmA (bactofilin family)
MFRRKEDGTDDLLDETNTESKEDTPVSEDTEPTTNESVTFPPAGTAAPAASAAAAGFRPAAPQSAVAARAAANSAATQASATATPTGQSSTAPSSKSTPTAVKPSKRVLTVGPDIQMKGEITTCDRVVIEGMVDATMKDVHTVELAQSGSLKGTAEVEDAEVSGVFEGDLVVHGRLIVYSTGEIRGNVTYGEIEIERGGTISGNIQNVDSKKESTSKASRKAA